jgi:hypothetical protein
MKLWTLEDIPWDCFDPAKVDPEMLKVIKAAAMVERNADDYARYLADVFDDDPEFIEAARGWAKEEVQHGRALARWAGMADPSFDFDSRFTRFTETIALPHNPEASVRGSRCGELIARCLVEVGTSSYYSALGSAAEEPVLKEICRRIATDEMRHYALFYRHMKRYRERERLGFWRGLLVVIGRIRESEDDDELPYAYYAANHRDDGPYDRKRHGRAYVSRTYSYYRRPHVERGMAMILKALGVKPRDGLTIRLAAMAHRFIRFRADRLARAGA